MGYIGNILGFFQKSCSIYSRMAMDVRSIWHGLQFSEACSVDVFPVGGPVLRCSGHESRFLFLRHSSVGCAPTD